MASLCVTSSLYVVNFYILEIIKDLFFCILEIIKDLFF